MSVDQLIFWLFGAGWAVVAAIFLVVIVPRIVSETLRIVRRVVAFAGSSDWPLRFAKAEGDIARIEAAGTAFPVLIARSEAAFAVLRASPLIPPAIAPFAAQVKTQIQTTRSAFR